MAVPHHHPAIHPSRLREFFMFGSGLSVGQWMALAAATSFLPGLAMLPYIRKAKKKALVPLFFVVPAGIGALGIWGSAAARGYGAAESLEMYAWCMAGLALLIVLGRPQIKRNEELRAAGKEMEQASGLYMAVVFASLGIAAVLAFLVRKYLIG
ncbi:hypothetical protein [Streptomyces sp. NPDC045369]|uniref:hypothetical protein n=1 Tax=Streptomyces sp. NPDC045369 TaxID=3155732 RepID=UPI0034030E83